MQTVLVADRLWRSFPSWFLSISESYEALQHAYCLLNRSKMTAIHFPNPPPSMGEVGHAADKSDTMTANIGGTSVQAT